MKATTTYKRLQNYVRRTAALDGVSTFDDAKIRAVLPEGFRKLESRRQWSFMRHIWRFSTVIPYLSTADSSSITYINNDETISGSGTTFQNAHGVALASGGVLEGDQIAVNGEQNWYEIASVTSDTALEMRYKYFYGSNNNASFIIARPWIALPDDFLSHRKIVGLNAGSNNANDLDYMQPEEFLELQQNYANVAQPRRWTIMNKYDNDDDLLMLWPFPDAVYSYDMSYNRRIGFLDIDASNAWFDPTTTEPAAGDIVLWDDRQMPVLRKAIILAAYEEYGMVDKVNMAEDRFEKALEDAMAGDTQNKQPFTFGGGRKSHRPDWY